MVDNISLVLGGFDPATKKFVGAETELKAQIAQIHADKKMPAKDKKEALADLNEALKSPPPAIENKGNIDIVAKYYDKLAEALGEGEIVVTGAIQRRSPGEISGASFLSPIGCSNFARSGAGAHAHHEAVVAQFSHLIPGQRFVTERRQARNTSC